MVESPACLLRRPRRGLRSEPQEAPKLVARRRLAGAGQVPAEAGRDLEGALGYLTPTAYAAASRWTPTHNHRTHQRGPATAQVVDRVDERVDILGEQGHLPFKERWSIPDL